MLKTLKVAALTFGYAVIAYLVYLEAGPMTVAALVILHIQAAVLRDATNTLLDHEKERLDAEIGRLTAQEDAECPR